MIVFAVLVSLLFVNIYVREKKEKQGCQENAGVKVLLTCTAFLIVVLSFWIHILP